MPTARQTAKMRGTSTASGVLLLDLGASSPPSSVGRNEYDPERQRTDIVEVSTHSKELGSPSIIFTVLRLPIIHRVVNPVSVGGHVPVGAIIIVVMTSGDDADLVV